MAARSLRRRRSRPQPPPVVFCWDLDKTYMKSEFERLGDLMRIPFEKAEDKVAAPGVAALIRALRETALACGREARTYFISASPPQIGRAIKKKLELDGVVYDGIIFKNQLERLIRGKFRHLREQVGFKLTELLKLHRTVPPGVREYLFGDDWESDPLIYSLYADVVAGRVDAAQLLEVLRAIRVDAPLIRQASELAEQDHFDSVARIFITLERRTPLATFRCFGPRLVPTFNYFQTAACLYEQGVLDRGGVLRVAQSLIEASHYTPERLANSLADLLRRGHVTTKTVHALGEELQREQLLPTGRWPLRRWSAWVDWWRGVRAWIGGNGTPAAETPAPIDYLALVAAREAKAGRPATP
jgi:hypothetical protein